MVQGLGAWETEAASAFAFMLAPACVGLGGCWRGHDLAWAARVGLAISYGDALG